MLIPKNPTAFKPTKWQVNEVQTEEQCDGGRHTNDKRQQSRSNTMPTKAASCRSSTVNHFYSAVIIVQCILTVSPW